MGPGWPLILAAAAAVTGDITWHEHIQPLVAARCTACHVNGGPAPFPLVSYDDVARRSAFVLAVVSSGRMPPWLPDESGPALQHVNKLSSAQIETLSSWVAAGQPRGREQQQPTPDDISGKTVPVTMLTMPEAWPVPSEGPRDMHTVVLPVGNEQSLFVRSVGWVSNQPRAVHGVTFLADGSGTARDFDALTLGPGYDSMGDVGATPSGAFGAIGPGLPRFTLPFGYAFEVPPHAHIVAEVHSLPTGLGGPMLGEVHMGLSEVKDPALVLPLRLLDFEIDVPPGVTDHVLHDAWTLPCAVELIGVLPQAGDVCRSLELFAVEQSTANTEPATASYLLRIPTWDTHFRRPYLFEQPVPLHQGTTLGARWILDNSADNPANPSSPPRRVQLGSRATDELVGMVLWVAPLDPADRPVLERFQLASVRARIARRGQPRQTLPLPETAQAHGSPASEHPGIEGEKLNH
ncbi:MAG: hypothetical protein ACI9EF_002068 [Pseudohongiellaceae bacterium]|jgi:hypothetical protein